MSAERAAGVERGPRDALALGALTAAWLCTLAFVGVRGEFPLNDDWAFARTAWQLLETGRFERVAWVYATSIPNVAFGAAVSAVFGPSFEVLRASTLLLGWLGVLGGYVLSRQVGAGPGVALLAAAALGWNPIYLNLSFTFMSDVPFTALCTWTLVFGVAGLRRRSWPALLGAVVLGGAALATRQPGLALPLSLLLAVVLGSRGRARRVAGLALTIAVGALGIVIAAGWLVGSDEPGGPFTLSRYTREYLVSRGGVYHAVVHGPVALAYLGWFLAPLAWTTRPVSPRDQRLEWLALGLGGGALLVLLAAGRKMPLGLNIVHARGIGPLTLLDADSLGPGPGAWWLLVTALATLGGATLVVRILREAWRRRTRLEGETAWLWLLLFPILYTAALSVRAPFFDRYLLACLPPLFCLLAWASPGPAQAGAGRLAVGWVLAGLLAVFAVAGTRDYLVHHRARWELLRPVLEAGVPPEQIHGGFEFGGLYLFGPAWRFVVDEAYRLSYADRIEGYVSVSERSYQTLFPPGRERIALHRRTSHEGSAP